MDLREAGIDEGISEVIVTTQSVSGVPNAAPIGIITATNNNNSKGKDKDENENNYFVKLYGGSKTLSNVQETNKLAASVTDDAVLFVKAAFEPLTESQFTLFNGFPVLKEANSWILFDCAFSEKIRETFIFRLTPLAVKTNRKEVKAINRGLNAVIEAAILATRYAITEDERDRAEREKQMAFCARIVEKCGGSREKEALKILQEKNKL